MQKIAGPERRSLTIFLLVAVLASLPALNFYYVGEEAIFPIASLEMWHSGLLFKQLLYGGDAQHNPLFNWLIMLFSAVFGWTHVLGVTRSIALASTLGSSLMLYWLVRRIFSDANFALLTSLIFLTFADVSLYHGWLAYVDPLYSFFIFVSIALLWVAAREGRIGLLAIALFSLELAFLSKALTAYVFYGASLLVLLRQQRERRFLLGMPSLALNFAALFFPVLWFTLVPSHGQGNRMFGEIVAKLSAGGGGEYFTHLLSFPLEALLRLLPAGLLAIYFLARKRLKKEDFSPEFKTAALMVLLNFLPYWLSPQSGIRYLLPIYPLFALIFSWIICNSGKEAMKAAKLTIGAFLALKIAFMFFLFPWYQSHYRGENYYLAAREIEQLSSGFALYSSDVSSSGLSVTGYLDVLRLPQAPLTFPPQKWDDGFVLSYTEKPEAGKIYRVFKLGGDQLFLLCRGKACDQAQRP